MVVDNLACGACKNPFILSSTYPVLVLVSMAGYTQSNGLDIACFNQICRQEPIS